MSENITKETEASVDGFLDTVEHRCGGKTRMSFLISCVALPVWNPGCGARP